MARPVAPFVLTPTDLIILQSWLRMESLPQNLAQRAKILLLLTEGLPPKHLRSDANISARDF